MIGRNRKVLLMHLPANALLLWLAYEWLGVDETTTARLLLSAVDALAILMLACWLYGATLVWFRSSEPRLNESLRTALRHIGGLLVLAVGVLAVYGLLAKGAGSVGGPGLKVASWLTWTLRTPVKPAWITGILTAIFAVLKWAVVPGLLLPLAAGIAVHGSAGWKEFRARYSWKHWVAMPVLALAAFWLPLIVMTWTPKVTGFGVEMASFVVRAAVAYGLFVVGSIVLLGVAASETPRNSALAV